MTQRRFRLTIILPILVGVVVAVAAVVFLISSIRTANRAAREQLIAGNRAMLSVSTRLMFNPLYESDVWTLNNMLTEFTNEDNIIYAAIRDIDGGIVAEVSSVDWSSNQLLAQGLATRAFAQGTIIQQEFDDQLLLIGPIATGPETIGTLEIVFLLTKFQRSIILNTIISALIAISLVATSLAIISIVFRRYILRPINQLTQAADRIGSGQLDTPIPQIYIEEPARFVTALEKMRSNLQRLYQDLETQVENLERRARYQEATAEVARDATSASDVNELISRAITLIDERFDFYRQCIFLLNPDDDWVVLAAASGVGVQPILESGNRLRIGQEGIVGHVSQTGQFYVAQNVHEDLIFVHDAGSTDIQSELALPLRTRGEMIGVLSVQSEELDAFHDEDIAVLETLADLIAIAISNSRLLQQAHENLETINRAYGELSRETWNEMLRAQTNIGYYSDESGVTPLSELAINPGTDDDLPTLDIPISVRGHIIGTIRAHKTESGEEWTEEESNLMKSMAEQLNLALESARLLEDTQRRAIQEQLTAEVTSRMRETLDIDTILQTAAREMRRALNLSEVEVRMGNKASLDE